MNQTIIDRLQAQFSSSIRGTEEFRNDLTVTMHAADVVDVARFLSRSIRRGCPGTGGRLLEQFAT